MSIRVNLLPHRELKRAARRRQFNFMLAAALIAGVGVVIIGHMVIAAREANQEARNKYLQDEIAKLETQIGKINEIKQQTQSLLARKQVVETLQSDRTEVVHLFDELIRRLPEGLYLKSFKQVGDTITIDGYTQSSARVSTLMRNLEESPWFEQANLVEIKAATVNNLRANEFVLTVKQSHQQAEKEPVKGAKA
ncbi:MAG TPA: PilN domain-containing protein [Thiobacillaceae bacterium]|nr:PilN domain-containing protein [Thiobacillaceae bacterium]